MRRRAFPGPAVPMHHGQPLTEDMDTGEAAVLKNGGAPGGFHESQPQ